MRDEDYPARSGRGHYRPARRVPTESHESEISPTILSEDFQGLAVAYGNTLLFIGYEIEGRVEIVVYPRYRFASDDRVQAQLGYVYATWGTPWEELLAEIDGLFENAEENYRTAVTLRAGEMRAHGSRYESAYDAIADVFRESWHGFSLRIRREGTVEKGGIVFKGTTPGPILAEFRGKTYTVLVFPTGSISIVTGDRRADLARC